MPLLQLPNEIIEQILYQLRNADLDCFAASCWSLRDLAEKRLREHAKRKAEELQIHFDHWQMDISSNRKTYFLKKGMLHPAPMLHTLLRADAAPYVRDLNMAFTGRRWLRAYSVASGSREEVRSKRTKLYQDIRAAVSGTNVSLGKVYNLDRLAGRLLDGEGDALLPVMFALAKRLRTITLNRADSMPQEVVGMLHDIAHKARSIDTPEQPLSRLTHVTVQGCMDKGCFFDLGRIEAFLRLPSIKSLTLEVDQISPCDGWDSLDFKSSLSSLNLTGYFKPKTLEQLLGKIDNLREFRYEYRTCGDECRRRCGPYYGQDFHKQVPFNPRLVRDRLLQHARHSLQHLTICHQYRQYTTEDFASSLGSLKGFEKLETVHAGSDMFNDADPGVWADGSKISSPYSFAHMLPPTIRQVKIMQPHVNEAAMRRAIACVPTCKSKDFPQLTDIEYEDLKWESGSDDEERELRTGLQGQGVNLTGAA